MILNVVDKRQWSTDGPEDSLQGETITFPLVVTIHAQFEYPCVRFEQSIDVYKLLFYIYNCQLYLTCRQMNVTSYVWIWINSKSEILDDWFARYNTQWHYLNLIQSEFHSCTCIHPHIYLLLDSVCTLYYNSKSQALKFKNLICKIGSITDPKK